MLKPISEKRLQNSLPQSGRVEWIGRAAARRAPIVLGWPAFKLMRVRVSREITTQSGCQAHTKRQVTLIQSEHLPVIAGTSGHPEISREWLRRNIVVSESHCSRSSTNVSQSDRRCWKPQDFVIPATSWNKNWDREVLMPCKGMAASLPEWSPVDRSNWAILSWMDSRRLTPFLQRMNPY